jgi:hypothetical protein
MRARPAASASIAPGRVLLVEALDSVGSSPVDARFHRDALEALGLEVRALVIDLLSEHRIRAGADAQDPHDLTIAAHRDVVREEARGFAPDLTLLASAAPGGGRAARWLPAGAGRLWPTGFHDGRGTRSLLPGPNLVSLPASADDGEERSPTPDSPGAEWSIAQAPDRRARQSLWDGDYVLSPAPLTRAAGEAALRAFAAAARDSSAVDLVVLGPRDSSTSRCAERIGIDTRVHFAGAAPRDAERAWVASASAVLLATDQPISAGLVLRALAASTPVVALEEGRASRAAARWLNRRGCAEAAAPGNGGARLGRSLARGSEILGAIARGTECASSCTLERVSERMASAIGVHAPRVRSRARREAA